MAGDEDDFSSLPLEERLGHKNWKARLSAYDDLKTQFKAKADSPSRDWPEQLRTALKDSNAAALESALNALLVFTEVVQVSTVQKTRSVLLPIVIDKAVAHMRATARQRAMDISLMYIEVENKADGVMEDLLPVLDHKTPKNVAAAVVIIKEALRLFGSKVVPAKPILKSLAKLFDHKDGSVRTEHKLKATHLAIELYKWLGPAILPSLNDLKPVQLKDLNDQFELLGPEAPRPKPERLVRAEMERRNAVGYVEEVEIEGAKTAAAVAPEPVDPFEFADPVNVLDKLPPKFYETLQAPKWSERKEILEALLVLVKVPKLEDGRYGELLNVLSKKINDPHVVVLTLAINCIEFIARGLRSNFSQYRGIVFTPLLEKLKEKKASVIEAIKSCLDAVYLCVSSISDILDDTAPYLAHKNPQIKHETTMFVIRALKTLRRNKPPQKADVKKIAETMAKMMDDADGSVREGAMEGFGVLLGVVGEKGPISLVLDGMDKGKAAKVREFAAAAGGASTGSAASVRPIGAKPEPVKEPVAGGQLAPRKPNGLPSKAATKPASSQSSATSQIVVSTAPLKKKTPNGPTESEPISFKFTDETAEAWMSENFPDVDLKAFKSIIRFLGKTPGWKENNFQVATAMIGIFDQLAKIGTKRGPLSLVLTAMGEKLGDVKLKKALGECFAVFAEKQSVQFVFSSLYEPIAKAKSPKTIADALLWMHQTLLDFGVSGMDVKALIEFVKVGLVNTNAGVRANAITLLGTLRLYVGPSIRMFVADLAPQQLAAIDAEFDKVADRAPPEPSRVAEGISGASEDVTDALFPRVDLTSKVSPELLDVSDRMSFFELTTHQKLAHAQWAQRKEALEELAAIIESTNKRLKPTLGEIPMCLKARLNDSNRNLGIMTAEICGNLAIAVGKPFARSSSVLMGPMISLLGDQKPQVRIAAANALENVYASCGLDVFVSPSSTALAEQPNLRKDLLKFLSDKMEVVKKAGDSLPKLEELLKPIFICLQDKNSDVRKHSGLILMFIADELGGAYICERAGDWYQGSALSSLKPYLDPLREVVKPSVNAGSSPKISKKSSVQALSTTVKSSAAASGMPAKKRLIASAPTQSALSKPTSVDPSASTDPVLSVDPKHKEIRVNQDRGMMKWTFETPRKDLVDFLQDQCKDHISEPVVALLFSTDHYKEKDFLHGLTLIDDSIVSAMSRDDENMKARFVANSDLILKYSTIRLFDTNTSMLIKVLELLEHLFALLADAGYTLNEYEAGSFLPFFIAKVGDNKETMRAKIRTIFKLIPKIYPPSKFFTRLLDALSSKNSRTRTECLEELGDLIKKNGMSVCISSKVLPVIAAQIGDSDAKVRNAALGTVTQAYMLLGDAVYKQLGKISEKEKSLLEEKVKRLPPPALKENLAPSVTPKVTESPLFKKRAVPPAIVDDADDGPAAGLVGIPQAALSVKKEFSLDLDKMSSETEASRQENGADSLMIDFLVTQVTAGDAYQSIDALKRLEKVIAGPAEQIVPYINEIVSAVTLQIRIAFGAADLSSTGTTRLCKHLVNISVQIFSLPAIAKHIQKVPLHQCVQELLNRLLDPNLQTVDQGPQLAKALNVLMVRVLDNTDRNLSFGILLNLLEQSATASVHCSPEDIPLQAKYTELVMKCLWKLTKVIPQLVKEKQLEPAELISNVHEFLKVSPPNEWKRRAAEKIIPQADMPLRTVKTILHELCNCLGEAVLQHIHLVEDPARSHAVGYIRQMLGQQGILSVDTPPLVDGRPKAKSPELVIEDTEVVERKSLGQRRPMTVHERTLESPNLVAAKSNLFRRASHGPLSEVEADAQLTVIFAKISAKNETKQGIADLYKFKKLHPDCEVYVNQHLSATGNYFQGYIKRGLAALENEEKNGLSEAKEEARVQTAPALERPALATGRTSFSSVGSVTSSEASSSQSHASGFCRQCHFTMLTNLLH
ncbi:Cytoskeleton associated protein 5 [Entophlyctis sp. JEL0112]|nr:Cytoskeleton associated protein 5 [Entophlyctis sp. JEL0112]